VERDIYQAPLADLELEAESAPPFYVVSRAKFLALYLATIGLYGIYWFYRHWRDYKHYSGSSLWPIPRAIFSIFFAHALFNRFFQVARIADPKLQWHPGMYATLYVVLALVSGLSDVLASVGMNVFAGSAIYFAAFFVLVWTLWRAQDVANLACGDPDGRDNRRLGLANIAWIILGLLLWLGLVADIVFSLGLLGPMYEPGT
jgi:hypothetical protein